MGQQDILSMVDSGNYYSGGIIYFTDFLQMVKILILSHMHSLHTFQVTTNCQ